jgi:hypothetical protein
MAFKHLSIVPTHAGASSSEQQWTLSPLGIAVAVMTLYCSPALAAADDDSTFAAWKFGLLVLGYLGAAIAFVVGLRRYKRADYWTRCQKQSSYV